jgi:hypothetical protein
VNKVDFIFEKNSVTAGMRMQASPRQPFSNTPFASQQGSQRRCNRIAMKNKRAKTEKRQAISPYRFERLNYS